MSATVLVKDAVEAGYVVGTVGKGVKPHALPLVDAETGAGATLCDRDGVAKDDMSTDAALCGTCARVVTGDLADQAAEAEAATRLIRELTATQEPTAEAEGPAAEEEPTAEENSWTEVHDVPVLGSDLRTVWYTNEPFMGITGGRIAELIPDTADPEFDDQGDPAEHVWDQVADLINTMDEAGADQHGTALDDEAGGDPEVVGAEAPTTIVPGPEAIETTQDRDEEARRGAEPTRVLVTTTDYRTVEGVEEVLAAGAAVIASAFKTTISIGLAVANTMLQLRRFIQVDGLPSLDGKANQYQAAVADLFDLATKQVADIHEVDVKEVRNQIKRAAQNQMSAVLVPYVRALDVADEEERARYAPLLEKAEESQRQAIESAQAYLDAAIKKDDQEHIDLAAETLELAQRPVLLSDLVHDHFDIPRQTRQELAKADAARRRELAKANKATRTAAAEADEEPEEDPAPEPTPVAPAASTPAAILGDVAQVLTAVPLAPVSMLEGDEREALLAQLDAIEKALAEIRDAANPL
ncbi:hypothetical protein [Kitasatospora sp. NPDC088779]|uniref:hypothetical protein n=1 Tax=Kitasatospora sp. NPDC088779 TaxID=3154964 RepID=UPI0034252829